MESRITYVLMCHQVASPFFIQAPLRAGTRSLGLNEYAYEMKGFFVFGRLTDEVYSKVRALQGLQIF
jgi:hypothetical protein